MLSEKLKELRQELGLTQKELGALLDISSNTIARYEREEVQPQHSKTLELAILQLRMTPKLKKSVTRLAMSREQLAKLV
jgi:transcriptional regulator with XRE-family HTH domain